jgi:putative addiction module component (TIGR02574 family)
MSTDVGRLALELLGLPARSRAELAEQLLASLHEEEVPELDDAQIEIYRRRAAELAEGKVEGISAEDVFRRLDEKLK